MKSFFTLFNRNQILTRQTIRFTRLATPAAPAPTAHFHDFRTTLFLVFFLLRRNRNVGGVGTVGKSLLSNSLALLPLQPLQICNILSPRPQHRFSQENRKSNNFFSRLNPGWL